MTEKTIRRYCRAVGSYLPCARRQKRQLLRDLRQRLEEYRDEHPDETSPEERFGTPQQVAAGYVDDMDTTELLQALRYRRRVITAVVSGILAALVVLTAALCMQLCDYHRAIRDKRLGRPHNYRKNRRKCNMKKLVTLILTALMILSLLPVQAFAADSNVIYYDDGSYAVVTIEIDQQTLTRASTIKAGTVAYNRYSTAGTLEWTASMKASFSYNGSTSTCISVNIPVVTIYNDNWSVVSQTSSKSGNTATANITMGLKQIIGTSKVPITLTLSCDKYGNLS